MNIRQRRISRGLLLVFEGIDGSGKSTHARFLYDYLTEEGFDAVIIKEPTKGRWGDKIREIARYGRRGISPKEELDYFINDRIEDVLDNIKPALDAKRIVIMDRYYISTMAYQGALGSDPEEILKINERFAPSPDVIFLLDLDPDIALSRIIEGREGINPGFEQIDYLRKVRAIFNSITIPNMVRIDAGQEIEAVSEVIIKEVEKPLKQYDID